MLRKSSDLDTGALFDAHAPALFSFLAYRTGDRALAEDLLADTFERALKAKGRYRAERGSEKTWLYSIALNLLRDHARRRDAEHRALTRAHEPEDEHRDPLAALDARDSVSRAMAGLSGEEREAVALRFGADLTVPEIAELVGEPLTTMEGRVYRALRKLRAELSEPIPQ